MSPDSTYWPSLLSSSFQQQAAGVQKKLLLLNDVFMLSMDEERQLIKIKPGIFTLKRRSVMYF
jgi:hypothetical protein